MLNSDNGRIIINTNPLKGNGVMQIITHLKNSQNIILMFKTFENIAKTLNNNLMLKCISFFKVVKEPQKWVLFLARKSIIVS